MYPRFVDQTWVTPYGLMLVFALVVCWLYSRRRALAAGIDTSHIDLTVPLIFILSTLGAKSMTYLIPYDTYVAGDLFPAHARFRLFGLLFVAFPLLFAYTRLADLPFRRMLDVFALPVVLWLAMLRIGCFMAGCCWGDLTQAQPGLAEITGTKLSVQILTLQWLTGDWIYFAVSYPVGSFAFEQQQMLGLLGPGALSSLPVHATQLYETALLLVLFGLLSSYERRPHDPGNVAAAVLVGYCVLRFFLEYLRADNALFTGMHTFTQLICVALAIPAAAYLIGFGQRCKLST